MRKSIQHHAVKFEEENYLKAGDGSLAARNISNMPKVSLKALGGGIILHLIAALALCFTPITAAAETSMGFKKIKSIPVGTAKTYDADFLKKKDIIKCLAIEKEMAELEPSITEYQIRLTDKTVEIQEIEDEIEKMKADLEQLKKKGFTVQADVDKYNSDAEKCNDKIAAHSKLAVEQKGLEKQYNSATEIFNSKVDVFREDCAKKQYYEDDYIQAMAEMN